MTDFIESDLYYTNKVSMYAASARLNEPPWSLLGRMNEKVRERAVGCLLSSVADLPGSLSFQVLAAELSLAVGLQSLSVYKRRLHAAADTENFVEQAAQPARRTASMIVLIAQRKPPAPRTLAAAIQPMPPLLLYGCQSAHHVSGLAA